MLYAYSPLGQGEAATMSVQGRTVNIVNTVHGDNNPHHFSANPGKQLYMDISNVILEPYQCHSQCCGASQTGMWQCLRMGSGASHTLASALLQPRVEASMVALPSSHPGQVDGVAFG